jgi:protein-disulfide isomerase
MKNQAPRARALAAAAPLTLALTAFSLLPPAGAVAALLDAAELAPDAPVARIDGKPIPYSELAARSLDKLALEQRSYDAQLKRLTLGAARARSAEQESELNKLVDEQVVALEAKARKTNAETLLGALKVPALTDAELHAFYDVHRAEARNQPFEAVKSQIVEYLRADAIDAARQQYLETLRQKYHIVLTWEPLREQVEATGPQRGPADARITIVEFSDFQCPSCRRLAPILQQLQEANPKDVRLVFRNLPVPALHPNAARAAQAGVCADAQGKFWQMYDAMYADQSALGDAALKGTASRIGLEPQAFNACLESAEAAVIKTDQEAGERLGLSGTPSSFLNGRYVNGMMPLFKWQALVDDELRRIASR